MFNKYLNNSGNNLILVKAASDCTVAGKNYQKGQLITTITEADFEISYASLNKTTTSKTFLLGVTDYEPRSIRVEAQNINDTLADMLFTKKSSNTSYNIPIMENQISNEDGAIFLNNIPIDETLFVYDLDKNLVEGWSLDDGGIITGLSANTKYFASYYIDKQTDIVYNVGKNSIPYLTLEIIGKGNVAGTGRNVLVSIPRASLDIEPSIQFLSGKISSISLVFNILEAKLDIVFY